MFQTFKITLKVTTCV